MQTKANEKVETAPNPPETPKQYKKPSKKQPSVKACMSVETLKPDQPKINPEPLTTSIDTDAIDDNSNLFKKPPDPNTLRALRLKDESKVRNYDSASERDSSNFFAHFLKRFADFDFRANVFCSKLAEMKILLCKVGMGIKLLKYFFYLCSKKN